MTRSKKIFFAFIAAFFATMIYVSYDISRKTTFPGKKKSTDTVERKPTMRE